MRTLLAVLTSAALLLGAEEYFPAPDAQGGWRTLQDAAKVRKVAGVDVAKLDYAFEYAQRTSQHGGLLVVRHGWLVYERYYGRGHREAVPAMASVGKAYTSVACGILLEDKKAAIPHGLDTKVFTERYLPEALPLDDPRKAEITLGHLLSMSAGLYGEGPNPGFVNGVPAKLPDVRRPDPAIGQDLWALRTPLWTAPGGGYAYASNSTHIASIVLRRVAGMEMEAYIDAKIAKPLGWGQWAWARRRADGTVRPHAPGGADIAVRSTDTLRFAYLLLHGGRWGKQQVVPAAYVEQVSKPSRYNPHTPFGLMFETNAGGHVAGAPRDAYFKSGAGGFGIYVIPSLDMVIYKMAGSDAQYDPARTGLRQDYPYDGSRDNWKPAGKTQFSDGPVGVDDGVRRVLEMVVAAVVSR
ncbi:MAG: serine hydrolase [Bryobacterales bacterium]|nr:serine hydrolase [Bryobacterales bacterium]